MAEVETGKPLREENNNIKRREPNNDLCNKRINLDDELVQTFFSVLKKKSQTLKIDRRKNRLKLFRRRGEIKVMSSNLEIYKLILKLPNLGEVKVTLHRIAAARTVQKIAFAAPFASRGMKRGEIFQIPTDIAIGKEKAVQSFKKGEVSFSPQGQTINVHLKDNEMPSLENRVGEVTEGLEILEKVKLSVSMTVVREE